jgi:GAF domain-containing protein
MDVGAIKDALAARVAAEGDDPRLRAILEEVCRITGMGFAAVARVTEDRWIACQVADKIEFGLDPGDELDLKTTICDEIRSSGEAVLIDHVAGNPEWRTHHTPALYGFESYVSLPVLLDDGSFYGTLCAIDPAPRSLSAPAIVTALQGFAARVGRILSRRSNAESGQPPV